MTLKFRERMMRMAEIIDIASIPKRDCSTCLWHDFERGTCLYPGGYNYNWKLNYCYSFQRRCRIDMRNKGENAHE